VVERGGDDGKHEEWSGVEVGERKGGFASSVHTFELFSVYMHLA
jgi:hypothetical protein